MTTVDWVPIAERVPDDDRLVLVFVHDPQHWRGREWKSQDVGHLGEAGWWCVGEDLYERDGSPFDGKPGARLTHWAELANHPDGTRGNPALDEAAAPTRETQP